MPAPVVVPAPVALVPAPAAVLPMPQKMSFSADALFAFDKSELKPDGKVMLEDLARQLKGASYDAIFVTGHADRLGRDAYNQKLSERRADTVKAFLVSQNIAADRVSAKGMGETQPVTKAGDCKGNKSASVIACLQPDRRVDVEVKASK
jgi:OOP family OmpA-OmpF porin